MITQYDMVVIGEVVEDMYFAAGPDTVKANGLESFVDYCRQAIEDDERISERVTIDEMKNVICETAQDLMNDD